METMITKTKTTLSQVVLFVVGVAMLGLGLSVMGVLALFAFGVVGLAFLAALVMRATGPRDDTAEQTV